jgi:surface antigen
MPGSLGRLAGAVIAVSLSAGFAIGQVAPARAGTTAAPARAGTTAAPARAGTTAAPARPHLLLIHGYGDSCVGAFKTLGTYSGTSNGQPVGSTQPNDTTAYAFLTGPDGGGWTTGDVSTVGYYTDDYSYNDGGGDAASGVCDVNLNQPSANAPWSLDTVGCVSYETAYYIQAGVLPDGTTDDPIMHLACLFAWYIYDTYTKNGIPVEIVAHSMGGLITRAAIGGATSGAADFPPALLVSHVVTVATPQGGIGGIEATAAWWSGQGTQEVADMEPGSGFMNTMGGSGYEKPQGTGGTYWALMGSSVPSGPPQATTFQGQACQTGTPVAANWSLARALACLQRGIDGDNYPDGDGVVNALSQMAMPADFKVLYGAVEDWGASKLYVADTSTEYEHESNFTCQSITLGPAATCTLAPFYLNDGLAANPSDPSTYTEAFVCAAACSASSSFSDLSLGSPVPVRHSLAEIATLLAPPADQPLWVTGHAANAGDDYPYETAGQFGHTSEGTDAWNEFYGQCDSFAAWKVYENLAGRTGSIQHPPGSIPALGWQPGNASISPVNQFAWAPAPGPGGGKYGNADVWASKLSTLGYTVDNTPTPGAIAWWPNAVTDPQDGNPPDSVHGIGSTGHVGYVTDVYPDGSINVEQYNMRENGEYSVVHLDYNEGYTDNSFGQPNFSVPWPGGFIHVADGPSGAASPPEPTEPGVVQALYPSSTSSVTLPDGQPAFSSPRPGLTVAGPGDGHGDFGLTGAAYPGTTHGWYGDPGHGETGEMLWTNTHSGAADSTATWDPHLTAKSCYQVDAFVPDNWSNNDAALYQVTDQYFGTILVPVDESGSTDDWVNLGVFEARSDGTIPVTLTDQGSGTGQVAADAMRYIQQPNCNGVVQASATSAYGAGMALSGASYPGTTDGWYANSGYGQLGNEYYTYTNGMTSSSSANWSAWVVPSACYEVLAYVPDEYADDYQAAYTVTSAGGSTPTVTVDENAYTNNFASLGVYRATSGGFLEVTLTDQSLAPGDSYVAADTMSFVRIACPSTVEGAAYPALTEGPGSPLSEFSLTSDWYSRYGHGDLGYEKWTNTNGATAVSKATWTFTGLPANATYYACAFIPDNFADNPAAQYSLGSSLATIYPTLDQATATGWTPLAASVRVGSDGKVSVTLNDTGPTGTYTAADAIRLTTTSAC